MKLNFDIKILESKGFYVKEGTFNGIEAFLVTPKEVGIKWTQEDKIFRSSIWSKDGEGLSFSFPKFTNLGEQPETFPPPRNLDNTNLIDKIDGSTAIIDWFNGQLNVRTRGTFNAKKLDNGDEFYEILNKYPLIEQMVKNNSHLSYLFEVVTPKQRIVLDYKELDCYLIGAVDKRNYKLTPQHVLDVDAITHGLKRPQRYNFTSLDELILYVKEAKGIEGCCIYSNGDKDIHKIKSAEYLMKHRLKSRFDSVAHVLDYWFSLDNHPTYDQFYDNVVTEIDYETAEEVKDLLKKVTDAVHNSKVILFELDKFAHSLKGFPRKDAAQQIMQGKLKQYSAILFTLLDEKIIPDKMHRQLIEQFL